MRLISCFAICTLFVLCQAVFVNGQAAKSELVGEVRDQNGALVPAKVTLTEAGTGLISTRTTDDGNYTITNLKPGTYQVTVEANGFKQAAREGVRLATGERVRLDFVLD